ncbi:NUDIX domain-containing protein [Roseibium denhamense]|uniref:ADP-ribose pyrophosphatase YjhB, NUDIX family n=1 Tax=Roseibium denhamense TaxID=76305 RepID=A0ABY1P551_9HYPH|nr:NUDIX hydrolase [Roseibium denhamense]MTI05196.1 NUDIX domain-containing protein [Roseibium denhamense]SMP25794.1 ADP-ribose pyrophosphatase YjhB, NUDIX family [Roseibium denhamense]
MLPSVSGHPRIGVSVLCHMDGRVLLIKRSKDPYKHHWSLPGGHLEYGETLHDAAVRELFEETGLTADLGEPIEVVDAIQKDQDGSPITHYVLVVFFGAYQSGDLKPGSDALESAWLTGEEVGQRLTTPGTPERVRRLMATLPAV